MDDKKLLNFRRTFPGFNETLEETDFSDVNAFDKDELFDLRGRLGDAYKRLLDRAEREKRELSPAEDDGANYANELLTELNREITRRTTKPARSIRLHTAAGKETAAREETRNGAVGRTGAEIFGPDGYERSGYRDATHYWQSVVENQRPERRTQTIGSAIGGGFVAPQRLAATIFDTVIQEAVFVDKVRIWTSDAPTLVVPYWDDADMSRLNANLGFSSWSHELKTNSETDLKLRAITLEAKKLNTYISISREAYRSASMLASQLSEQLAKNIRLSLEYALWNGTGTGQPLGILQSPCRIELARTTAGSIVMDDVVEMYTRLASQYLKNAAWFISQPAMADIFGLEDGSGRSIFVTNASEKAPGRLLGLPCYINPFGPALGTLGDIALADMSQFHMLVAQGIEVDQSDSVKWYEDARTYRAVMRVDAQCGLSSVITPLASGATQSAIVLLAA